MRRFQFPLLAAFAVIGLTSITQAADMAVKVPPPAPIVAPAYSWTGFYVGGNLGYAWGDPTVAFSPNDINAFTVTCGGANGGTCPPPASFGVNGGLGGLQAGYNWQVNRSWLLGLETDFNLSHINGSGTSNFILGNGASPSNFQASENVEWFGTVRGRLGFIPSNSVLLYATGGLAYGRVQENVALNTVPSGGTGNGPFAFECHGSPTCFLGSSSRIDTGWTAGGGFEFSLWQNV